MKSEAATVAAFLAELPEGKRDLVASLRALVLENLPDGYVEAMNWGMICYEVPLEVSGQTYNGKPLMYVAIGAQKHHVGLYLCGLNCRQDLDARFRAAWGASGLKLDMGKACLRVKSMNQIDRQSVADAIAALPVNEFVAASHR